MPPSSHRAPLFPLLPLVAALSACAPAPPSPAPPVPLGGAPPASRPLLAVSGACVTRDELDAGDGEVPPELARAVLEVPVEPGDTCAVADSNLQRAASAILAAAHPTPAPPAAQTRWDHRTRPLRLDEVTRRFGLSAAEIAALRKNGFVVPARLEQPTYADALHEVYASELPLFVSADAVLHAVYVGNDKTLARLEQLRLAPLLDRTLAVMHCALPDAASGYPPETARDLDVYLTVARTLLAGHPVAPAFNESTAAASALVAAAQAAAGMAQVEIFGRVRWIDFSAFTPRGHYAAREPLTPYFRAVMWLSRVEWNLVSRSSRSSAATAVADPRETPREAVDALALADLTTRAGVRSGVRAMDRAWATFGGKREEVSIDQLEELRARAGIGELTDPGVFERLRDAIGESFQRTTRLQFMPAGSTVLPAIATLLGPRVRPDATATGPLVSPRTPERHMIGAAEMGYALGQDRARVYLADEEARFPQLAAGLGEARALAHAASTGEDLFGLWLQAILGLGERPAGALPSFMTSDAFADLRLDSTITAFAQLRHDAVLIAGQAYDEGGCTIPDGYVEPAPAVYQRLIAYAERGAAAVAVIDPGDQAYAHGYFTNLARVLRVLDAISADELAGRPLSASEIDWLSMVVEREPGTSQGPPTFTGWYFDMFPARLDALVRADLVADYFTSGETQTVAYVGATSPRLGIFVVDTGGAPRVVVGPVARGYEHHGPLGRRLDDAAASHLVQGDRQRDPWAASYTVPAPPAPELELSFESLSTATLTAARPLGPVTVEALDHHRHLIEAVTHTVAAGKTTFAFEHLPEERPIELVHVKVGAFHAWSETWKGAPLDITVKKPAPAEPAAP